MSKLDFKEIEEYCICPYCNNDIKEFCENEIPDEIIDEHMEYDYFSGNVKYWKEIFTCPVCNHKIWLDCSW